MTDTKNVLLMIPHIRNGMRITLDKSYEGKYIHTSKYDTPVML